MSDYQYAVPGFTPRRLKVLEGLSWVAMAVFLGFSILLFKSPDVGNAMKAHWPLYIGLLGLLYLMFLLPTRSLSRYRKYSSLGFETSRKGFTYVERGEARTFSWRDLKSVKAVLDVHPATGVFVRRLDVMVPKLRIRLDNEPPRYALTSARTLLAELEERSPSLGLTFVWYYPVCPFCRHDLKGADPCGGCGRTVVFRQKVFRPWDLLKEDTAFVGLFLLFIVLGPNGIVFGSTLLMIFLWALTLPMMMARPAKLRVLDVPIASPSA